ncbi:MAG: hypothetical protein ABL927_13560 [Bdellovibrionales bacterium]
MGSEFSFEFSISDANASILLVIAGESESAPVGPEVFVISLFEFAANPSEG